jgi:hypothetical protein
MASEPEKKIEELLRGYSRKRREDAGAPMEMHPATRRILQGEVAKLAKAGQRQPRSWWQSFFLMWPRFAATVGMFAVLAVGVWVITQSEKKPASEFAQPPVEESLSRVEAVADAKKDAQPERDGDALADVRVAPEALKKSDSAKRSEDFAYNERKAQVRDLERAPADTTGVAPVPAPTASQPVTLTDSLQEKNFSLRYDSPSKPAPGAVESKLAISADKQRELAQMSPPAEAQLGQYFRQSAAESTRENEARAKAPVGELAAAAISGARVGGGNTNVNLFSFADQISSTNASQRGYPAPSAGNLEPGQAVSDFAVAYSQPAPAPSAAAVAPRPSLNVPELAKNERARNAAADEFAGVEIVAAKDEFERIDANAMLLRTFEVQKSGDRIQIRDADGSVYDGTILQRAEVGAKTKETTEELRTLPRNATARLADADDQGLSFRASGTNKSLRQLVTINGQFLEHDQSGLDAAGKVLTTAGATRAPAPTPPSTPPRVQPAPVRGQQTLPTNRTLAERAVLGRGVSRSNESQSFKAGMIRARVLVGTNEVNVNAIRRRPDR